MAATSLAGEGIKTERGRRRRDVEREGGNGVKQSGKWSDMGDYCCALDWEFLWKHFEERCNMCIQKTQCRCRARKWKYKEGRVCIGDLLTG